MDNIHPRKANIKLKQTIFELSTLANMRFLHTKSRSYFIIYVSLDKSVMI